MFTTFLTSRRVALYCDRDLVAVVVLHHSGRWAGSGGLGHPNLRWWLVMH